MVASLAAEAGGEARRRWQRWPGGGGQPVGSVGAGATAEYEAGGQEGGGGACQRQRR